MDRPRLRDNQGREPFELYPIGIIPDEYIYNIGKHFAYYYAVGKSDITGNEWGDIFAAAIGGNHLKRPVGIADVLYGNQCWSSKTIKYKNPHKIRKIRVISGRCSPDYSYGITNPHTDVQRTGTAVLSIYNERINIAMNSYSSIRSVILVRNFNTFEFTLFEYDTHRYVTSEYEWRVNTGGNLEGFEKSTDKHYFTWQPHGAQFSIIYDVPSSSTKFVVKLPEPLDFEKTLQQVGFDKSWVTLM